MTYYIVMFDGNLDVAPSVQFITKDYDKAVAYCERYDFESHYIETYHQDGGI